MTSEVPAPAPTVIGVVGAPRSGSTILGAVLAEQTGGFHVGELHLLWDRLATDRLCGCGNEVKQCEFWSAVWAEVRGTAGVDDPREACELWADAVRMRQAFTGRADRDVAVRFRTLMDATYRSIARLSGASVVIDTSKHPGYFRTMAASETPIRLIQLTRDPRALAYSWSKPKADPDQPGGTMKVRSPAVVAAEWIGLNALGLVAGRGYDDFQRVRYETMVVDGLDLAVGADRGGSAPMTETWNHTVAGNPLRMSATDGELRLDDRWVTKQPTADRAVVTALTAPILPFFGYRLSR